MKKEKSEVILDELVKIIKGLTPEKLCGALLRDVAPLAGGLSWLTVFCFLLSAALLGWAFVWKDQKNNAPGFFPRGIQTPMPFCPAWASL